MPETILVVDDEEPVRRTFLDWLARGNLDARVLSAGDAETALALANEYPIDLAILDWNLGAGSDGLQLLQDLVEFNADIVAVLITGHADQATPLQALRMGVRDYIDKSTKELNRDTFLAAVRKQLDKIAPAKRQRAVTASLLAFREAVEKVMPLVQAAAALNDPVPLPRAIMSLFRFLKVGTGAADGVLLVRHIAAEETSRAYDPNGQKLDVSAVPFARSLAAAVASRLEPASLGPSNEFDGLELHPFEQNRSSVLAVPLDVGQGTNVLLELFDKAGGGEFTAEDRILASVAGELGAELLRQALAERQTHGLLLDAVAVALREGDNLASSLRGPAEDRLAAPPADALLAGLRQGLDAAPPGAVDATETLALAEAVRELAVRHGPAAVRHCTRLVVSARTMLDEIMGG